MPIGNPPLPDEEPLPETGDGRELDEVKPASTPASEPTQERRIQRREAHITSIQTTFSGPLPPPEMLRAYNEIEPGLAREIIELAKVEADHRQIIEKNESAAAVQIALEEANANTEDMRRGYLEGFFGQCFAFVFGVFALTCATYLAINGAQTTACIIGGGGLVAIISAFLKRPVSSVPTRLETEPQAHDKERPSGS